jgi:hypothetical protein
VEIENLRGPGGEGKNPQRLPGRTTSSNEKRKSNEAMTGEADE